MRIDLTHNKIISDTVTEQFVTSVNEVLLPLVTATLGEVTGIQMYEDHIADGTVRDGRFYYPLTVLRGDEAEYLFISWRTEPKRDFVGGSPFAYVGEEPLDFTVCEDVPPEICECISGRARYFEGGTVKLNVHTSSNDPLFLAGKYSQTFVDEMARQLTAEMSRILGVRGLPDSSVELQLVFAPGTYMEHTSESVTYRRLLLTADGCRPRDFWVRWTRLDGSISYTVSNHVTAEQIKFELGEDVPQKIREKEYRFLCSSNPDKYQSAMGKRTVTEWREVIKRAVSRGELERIFVEEKLTPPSGEDDFELRLAEALGRTAAPVAEPVTAATDEEDPVAAMARAVLERSEARAAEEDTEAAPDTAADPEIEVELIPECESAEDRLTAAISLFDAAEEVGSEDLPESVPEAEQEVEQEAVPEVESVTEAMPDTSEDDRTVVEEAAAIIEQPEDELLAAASRVPEVTREPVESAAEREARLRREIEAQVRLEMETEARERAEREAQRLREESEALRAENERLAEAARRAEEERARLDGERAAEAERSRREEARLRAELDAKRREELRERDRLAEAARQAVDEQRRIEAEQAKERELAAAREAERLAREEAERIAEERRQEAERIRREREERLAAEAAAAQTVPPTASAPTSAADSYVSRHARILFRRNVDLNVITRIKQIVEDTLAANRKEHIRIHIKAYPQDATTIALDVRIPESESELLISIIKAIGNGGIGVTRITLE